MDNLLFEENLKKISRYALAPAIVFYMVSIGLLLMYWYPYSGFTLFDSIAAFVSVFLVASFFLSRYIRGQLYSLKVTRNEIIIKIYKETRISLQNIKNYRVVRIFTTGYCKFEIKYFDLEKQEDLVVEITLTHINDFINLMNQNNISEIKV